MKYITGDMLNLFFEVAKKHVHVFIFAFYCILVCVLVNCVRYSGKILTLIRKNFMFIKQ